MCDQDIHPGLIEDWSLTRRSLVLGGVAVASFASACAQAAGQVIERDVTVPTADGTADAALFHPAGKGPWPAVLMWPDIMGLRPVFREMGRRLAAQGYVVLVPNPFYRIRKAPVLPGPINFGDPETRKTLMGYRATLTNDATNRDATAFLAFLDAQAETDSKKKAGVQGYCMGGPLSFRTAAAVPARIGAVASFHGGGLTTTDPTSPHLLIPQTNAAYLVAVARDDDARDPQSKETLKAAFADAHKSAVVDVYAADHGWCVPGSAVYDEKEAERAWAALTTLYKTALS